jgi:hypothetical protein
MKEPRPRPTPSPALVRAALATNGLLLIAVGLLIDFALAQPFTLGVAQLIIVVLGMGILMLSIIPKNERNSRFFLKVSLPLPFLFLALGLTETASRAVGYDFGRQLEALQNVPIFYRQPREPVGEIYFRRRGPDRWEGDVLADGKRAVAEYDSLGFRNPPNLVDWDVVIVGDSFVEAGYLSYEELFTTQIGDLLGLRVKNLGVSHTGPLTYCFYLSEYGASASTKLAICVFFEGNDIENLDREAEELETFRTTGERPFRNIQKSSSFLKSLSIVGNRTLNKVIRVNPQAIRESAIYNSYFVTQRGEVEVGVDCTPYEGAALTVLQEQRLAQAVD